MDSAGRRPDDAPLTIGEHAKACNLVQDNIREGQRQINTRIDEFAVNLFGSVSYGVRKPGLIDVVKDTRDAGEQARMLAEQTASDITILKEQGMLTSQQKIDLTKAYLVAGTGIVIALIGLLATFLK